jgi:hypothetical protein
LALAQRTITGIFWIYTSYFGGRIMTLITTAILARLLAPDDFGVIQAAMTFIVFLELFSNIGVNDALIYNTKEQEQTADTVFIINVALGVLQFVLALMIAPFVGAAFNDPRGVTIVQLWAHTRCPDAKRVAISAQGFAGIVVGVHQKCGLGFVCVGGLGVVEFGGGGNCGVVGADYL